MWENFGVLKNLPYFCCIKTANVMKENKPYPILNEEDGDCPSAHEPVIDVALAYEEMVVPGDVPYAHIEDGVLQVTPDIEEEVSEMEREGTVTMAEFKTMFSKWL